VSTANYEVRPVGRIESPLVDRDEAPRQGDEGAPDAWIVFDEAFQRAMRDLSVGDRVVVLTWLDRADRTTQSVHPRGEVANPITGVFSTRSADRPNPIGLHPAQITAIDGLRVKVGTLEAIDGTPVLDVKPVLEPRGQR
jgi:tRNA-Thr(GGU) m(6)t(6)A37 methyltransferase TsaA